LTLLADIKTALRITSDAFDTEVETLIGAALADLERVGVNPALLDAENLPDPLVRHAVTAYCKAHFGYDNDEAGRFEEAYRRVQVDLLNSKQNIAAIEEEPSEAEETDGEAGGE